MTHSLAIVILCLSLFALNIEAGNIPKTIKFSSVYTNPGKDCHTIKDGMDIVTDCPGIGGYRIQIFSSSVAQMIVAEPPDKKNPITLAMQRLDFDPTRLRIEWRLANGKPFAVILRVEIYSGFDEDGPLIGRKVGEILTITGLKGLYEIDSFVESVTPSAYRVARRIADSSFRNRYKIFSSLWSC